MSGFQPYQPTRYSLPEMQQRADAFYAQLDQRRSLREFSNQSVPEKLIERAIETASTAPSGAHRQPWRFVAVSNPKLKAQIREAAEAEEKLSYEERMSDEWLDALRPFGTNWQKPFLETAPWLVVVMEESYGLNDDGSKTRNYYVKESVGIACGLFITALHNMGLVTLTHTPSPMGFLSKILNRPENEKPFMLFPVGFPADDASVPILHRKSIDEIAVWHRGEE